MKHLLLILGGIFLTTTVIAQTVGDTHLDGLVLITSKQSEDMDGVKGSPYLEEEFKRGTFAVEGKEPIGVFLRFDVSKDQMEIKTDLEAEEVYKLPMSRDAEYQLGGKIFRYGEILVDGKRIAGHFIEHYGGDSYRLLEKPVIDFTDAVKATTGYDEDQPARIEIDREYFIVDAKGNAKRVEIKHRDIKKAFEDDQSRDYLSDNKIRDLEDLKDFVEFLDQQ